MKFAAPAAGAGEKAVPPPARAAFAAPSPYLCRFGELKLPAGPKDEKALPPPKPAMMRCGSWKLRSRRVHQLTDTLSYLFHLYAFFQSYL